MPIETRGHKGIEFHVNHADTEKVKTLLAQAAVKGADPVLALHRGDYLLHTRRRRQLQADTLVQAADLLHQATVKQLQGGHTPLDTKNAVEAWLRQQAAELQAANGGV